MALDTISTALRAADHNQQSEQAVSSLSSAVSNVAVQTGILLELALYGAQDPDLIMDALYIQELKKKIRAQRNLVNAERLRLNLAIDALHASDQAVIDAAALELTTTHSVDYSSRFPVITLDTPE